MINDEVYMDFSKVLKDCTVVWLYSCLPLEVFLFRIINTSYDRLIRYSNFRQTIRLKDVVTRRMVELFL